MTLAQVLAKAAKLVEQRWGRAMPHCALGAIGRAQKTSAITGTEAYVFFMEFCPSRYGLGLWNDAPGRTGHEVACWLSSAAEYAKVLGK